MTQLLDTGAKWEPHRASNVVTHRVAGVTLAALEQALRARQGPFDGRVHHSDRRVPYLSIRYTDRLANLPNRPPCHIECMDSAGSSVRGGTDERLARVPDNVDAGDSGRIFIGGSILLVVGGLVTMISGDTRAER